MDITITGSGNGNLLQHLSITDFGTPGNPKITYIDTDFEIDEDIIGYGIMIVEGELKLKANFFELHGLIIIVCRGQYNQNNNNCVLWIWGAVLMVSYNDPYGVCSGISAEERIEITKGDAHIYYSTDAMDKYANLMLYLSIISWR